MRTRRWKREKVGTMAEHLPVDLEWAAACVPGMVISRAPRAWLSLLDWTASLLLSKLGPRYMIFVDKFLSNYCLGLSWLVPRQSSNCLQCVVVFPDPAVRGLAETDCPWSGLDHGGSGVQRAWTAFTKTSCFRDNVLDCFLQGTMPFLLIFLSERIVSDHQREIQSWLSPHSFSCGFGKSDMNCHHPSMFKFPVLPWFQDNYT